MPASTVLSEYTFTNMGPLTTTFTQPAACTTPSNIMLAYSINPEAVWYNSACNLNFTAGSCLPSGSEIDKIRDQSTVYYAPYYSPGLVCPASWTTAGAAARVDSTSVSSAGYFAPTSLGTEAPLFNPAWNVFMDNLDVGETVAVCCPSGWTAGPVGDACHTNIPASLYTATTACQRHFVSAAIQATFLFNETTVSGYQIIPGGSVTSKTITVDPNNVSSMTGVAKIRMATLVFRKDDAEATSNTTNAGGSFKIAQGDGTVGTMFIVWGAAAILGAILFGAA